VLLQLLAANIPIVLGTAEVDERERVERRLRAKWKLGLHAKSGIAAVGRQAESDLPVSVPSAAPAHRARHGTGNRVEVSCV
jgi:hypothetical protein